MTTLSHSEMEYLSKVIDVRMKMPLKQQITMALAFLVTLEMVLSVWGFFFPEAWYWFFHGADYIDPQGLLRRCAANWLGFLIVQAVALARWERAPWLLTVVAGCRFSDVLTDITCLIFADSISVWGAIAFPVAGLGNLAFGFLMIWFYRQVTTAHGG